MKKESSYQKMKRKHEEQIAGMAADIRVLALDKEDFNKTAEVKTKWRHIFMKEDALFYGNPYSGS